LQESTEQTGEKENGISYKIRYGSGRKIEQKGNSPFTTMWLKRVVGNRVEKIEVIGKGRIGGIGMEFLIVMPYSIHIVIEQLNRCIGIL